MAGKEEIRIDLLNKRDSLSSEQWNGFSSKIQKTILESNLYKDSDKLFIYSDYHGEVGTLVLIEDALLKGKDVFLPKCHENFTEARMDFYKITSTCELVNGYKGILEPMENLSNRFDYESNKESKLLMFVPGVVYDKNNNRMGYGKGYYDNYLKDKPNMIKIGIAFSLQVIDEIPVTENDIKMDFIVTENTTLKEINKVSYNR
ncbi:MAG: 5-formyltetrahydrofolate cyclo-ligase [Lachnospiraceae bacterium]|nr:5-formyltetrahydrofolate cyclo-ligase [Lachnospiraceae bacterium]